MCTSRNTQSRRQSPWRSKLASVEDFGSVQTVLFIESSPCRAAVMTVEERQMKVP